MEGLAGSDAGVTARPSLPMSARQAAEALFTPNGRHRTARFRSFAVGQDAQTTRVAGAQAGGRRGQNMAARPDREKAGSSGGALFFSAHKGRYRTHLWGRERSAAAARGAMPSGPH